LSNKVRFGLKNAYYATVTFNGNTPTYGTPVALPGAVSITMEAQGESTKFYADNGIYFQKYANNGYEGTLELAQIPDDFLEDCLGMQTDNNGLVIESASDTPAEFALLFEFTGDVKGTRHAIYRCSASRPNQDADTAGETLEVKTEEIKITGAPLPGTEYVKSKTGDTTPAATYNSWFTTVQLPDFPELTVSPNPATYADADVALTVNGGTVSTVKLDGTSVASSNYTVSGSTVTIKSADYLEDFAAGTYRFELATSGGDNCIARIIIPS